MTTKFKGHCEFCGADTRPGIDHAARNGNAWIAVCATCATSITEQVKGLVRHLQDAMPGMSAEVISNAQTMLPVTSALQDAIAGALDENAAYDVLSKLQTTALYVKAAALQSDPIIDGLQAVMNNAAATPKDRAVAADMSAAAAKWGKLTANQASYAKSIIARYDGSPVATPAVEVTEGIYTVEGTYYLVKRAQKGHLYAMVMVGTPTPGHKLVWEMARGAMRNIAASGKAITAEQAADLGHKTHHCCFCSRDLSDDREGRSIEVGYGPVCASKHGLPWG